MVVPGWGAFIANSSPAHYSSEISSIQRPQRSVGFNSSLSHNDGLLVNSIMRREGMSYDEAMRAIEEAVVSFRHQLAKGAEVSMGKFGYFSRSGKSGEFVPFANDNSCDAFFGLADLKIQTVDSLEQDAENSEAAGHVLNSRNIFTRKAARIAASIAVLIGLSIMLSTPIITHRDGHDYASMAPKITAPQPQQLSNTTVQDGVASEGIERVESNSTLYGVGNQSGKYYMVIATLRNQHEIDAFKKKYSDLVPYMRMLSHNGLTHVYVARSDDYNTFMNLRCKLPERLRDIWIYS